MPTSALPKRCRCGSTVGQETLAMSVKHGESEDDVMDEMGERGHILWIRGLSRLQHQVNGRDTALCVIISRNDLSVIQCQSKGHIYTVSKKTITLLRISSQLTTIFHKVAQRHGRVGVGSLMTALLLVYC